MESLRSRGFCYTEYRMTKRVYTIDGVRFINLVEFYNEFGRIVGLDKTWGKNLDAFEDVLSGGFATPPEGFSLVWKHSALSRQRLGIPQTLSYLEHQLATCDSSQRNTILAEIEKLKQGSGQTLFDILIEIIKEHSEIELRLD